MIGETEGSTIAEDVRNVFMSGTKRRLGPKALRWGGLVVWGSHVLLARIGAYRCPRCKSRLNYRWWCKRCMAYRLPAR